MTLEQLKQIARLLRYYVLVSTTQAGSGHPTSCLSSVELVAGLVFGGNFRFNASQPRHPGNDRLIFSKGHAAPLFYALWAVAGKVSEGELLSLRKFGSPLEGHPTTNFPFTEVATGSLGQGLSVGLGMALAAKLDKLSYKTFVLLGDGEMAEGQVAEAMQLAAHYKLDNLIAIVDVNGFGQTGKTMYGRDLEGVGASARAFGWEVLSVDGHNLQNILQTYINAVSVKHKPVMILGKTVKGKGISFLENKENWHGKALSESEFAEALKELGEVNKRLKGVITSPEELTHSSLKPVFFRESILCEYPTGEAASVRKAFGSALVKLAQRNPLVVALDGDVSNSTYAGALKKALPDRFFEMYIAEQNMVGVALGLARCGKIPFVSTFSAFLSRAFDQIRMSQYSAANVKFVGSHAGVSVGEDGPSQMGLEDLALFRSVLGMVVLYPADAVAAEKLTEAAARHTGNVYLRTTRDSLPVIYPNTEKFSVGGSKILRQSSQDKVTVIGAGITVHEALTAYNKLKRRGVLIRVIDLYSIKPLDVKTLLAAAEKTRAVLTVEDHFVAGGLGEAVAGALAHTRRPVYSLAVTKMPKSGKSAQLLSYEGINAAAIVKKVSEVIKRK